MAGRKGVNYAANNSRSRISLALVSYRFAAPPRALSALPQHAASGCYCLQLIARSRTTERLLVVYTSFPFRFSGSLCTCCNVIFSLSSFYSSQIPLLFCPLCTLLLCFVSQRAASKQLLVMRHKFLSLLTSRWVLINKTCYQVTR